MHVHKTAADAIRTDALQRIQGTAASQAPVEPTPAVRGTDAVQISDAGLALSGTGVAAPAASSLDPTRADQIRSSILSGAYNSLESADQVARAVLRSGDL
ncbi:MAG TPA: hypothetical protein VII66_09680 [Gemmatimonadaceae bacterium]